MRAVTLAGLLPLAVAPVPSGDVRGLVVEEVTQTTALARAGIQAGDLLLGWSQQEEQQGTVEGVLYSVIDALELEAEHAPRGPIRLAGIREGVRFSREILPGLWDLHVHPAMPATIAEPCANARRLGETGEAEAAFEAWQRAIEAARSARRPDLEQWLLVEMGVFALRQVSSERATAAFQAAKAIDSDTSGRTGFARGWAQARALRERGEYATAYGVLEGLLRHGAYPRRSTLMHAMLLNEIGVMSWFQGRLDAASESFTAALELRETLAPGSLAVAASLSDLGLVAWSRGDLAEAERRFLQGLEIKRRLAPGSFDFAYSLTNLGIVTWRRGDLPGAEAAYREALAIYERQKPGRHAHARALNNLALVFRDRGDLKEADRLLHAALEIWKREAPQGADYVNALSNLGALAAERGDLVTAERLQREGLEGKKRLGREHRDVVSGAVGLSAVLLELGRFGEAQALLLEAARLGEEQLAGSGELADVYSVLGVLAKRRSDLVSADRYHRKALDLVEEFAPLSINEATERGALGRIRFLRGDPARAEPLLKRAVELLDELAPGTADIAFARRDLAALLRADGRLEPAAEQLRLALEALERQRPKVGGGDDQRSRFEPTVAPIYWDAIELFVLLGGVEEAFRTLERSRARAYLETLAARDLGFEADLTPELARRRRLLTVRYDKLILRLGRSKAGSDEARLMARELAAVRDERTDLSSQIAARSPRVANMDAPEPIDVEAIRDALDPGTLVLAYSIGARRSFLFTLSATGPISVHTLATDRDRLRVQVAEIRGLLAHPTGLRAGRRSARLAALSELLLSPAAHAIRRADRLLILPDGPLHTLPFGTLSALEGQSASSLVETVPIHRAPSATAFAELRRRPQADERPRKELAAFGDPLYGGTNGESPEVRTLGGSFAIDRLPDTRREVERVVASFGAEADAFVGADASEERVKTIASHYRRLHFACHATLDERFPLDSALVLSTPDPAARAADNGLLQAWEVLETLRIDADLVVLSACETGLGRELAGEGMLGLTRSFFHAGARSVLASLWRVDDRATADLMERFYKHLEAGSSKDDALRRAQLDLLRDPAFSDPHYWAGFVLHGDPR